MIPSLGKKDVSEHVPHTSIEKITKVVENVEPLCCGVWSTEQLPAVFTDVKFRSVKTAKIAEEAKR